MGSSIDIAPIGSAVLPDDLVAPMGGAGCCGGRWYLVDIRDVVRAFMGEAPIVCPSCLRAQRPSNIELVAFVSRREWESTPDTEDAPAPKKFFIGQAFRLPRVAL